MTEQTKKYLIIGGGFVLAIVVGIIVYKKYEAGSTASQAAADQSSQDELAYLEAQSMQNAYAGFSGGGGISVASPTSPTGTSLAQEIQAIEQAFGYGPPPPAAAPVSSPTGSPAGGSSNPPAPAPPQKKVSPLPVPPEFVGGADYSGRIAEDLPQLQNEGVVVA
jgi:hypothetical protein